MASNFKFQKGQTVIYNKTGEVLEIKRLLPSLFKEPEEQLYFCSDEIHHKSKNLTIYNGPIKPIQETTKEEVIRKWGLNKQLNLVQVASDFYITQEAALDFPVLKPQADKIANQLATEFSNYLIMVIGGELRHTRTQLDSKWISGNVKEIIEEIRKINSGQHISRKQAWLGWYDIYHDRGQRKRNALIKTSRRIFRKGRWQKSYGGNNWSKIALTLYNYLTGEDSAITFIDTVFGLYHNCNLVLDKVYKIDGLKRTLDDNFKHDMNSLYKTCSKDTRGVISIYRRFKDNV